MARYLAALLLVSSTFVLAQEPKAAPKVKFTQGQIGRAHV